MSAIMFSLQNDAGLCMSDTQYWENLVLIVILVLEYKGLDCCTFLTYTLSALLYYNHTSLTIFCDMYRRL